MKSLFLILVLSVFISACASGPSVVKETFQSGEATVILSEAMVVQPGEKVEIFKKVCREANSGGRFSETKTVCKETIVGEARVMRLNSSREAVLSAYGDIAIKPGMIVKKVQ